MMRIKRFAAVLAIAAAPAIASEIQEGTPRTQDPNRGTTPAAGAQGAGNQGQGAANQGQREAGRAQPGAVLRLDDRLFVAAAAESGLTEVAASQLAAERASSDEIKEFARRMIEDHTRANRELMTRAQAAQINVPRELPPGKQAELAILSAKSGEEFDRAYAQQQLAAHICAAALFRAGSEGLQGRELKAFASETLPKIEDHLEIVRRLAGEGQGGARAAIEAGHSQDTR